MTFSPINPNTIKRVRESITDDWDIRCLNNMLEIRRKVLQFMTDTIVQSDMLIQDMNVYGRSDDEDAYDNTAKVAMSLIDNRFRSILNNYDYAIPGSGYDIVFALEAELKSMIRQDYRNISFAHSVVTFARYIQHNER